MKLKKFMYTTNKKVSLLFKNLHLMKSDIMFLQKDKYTTFRLKHIKTNIDYNKILIMLAIINSITCPVTVVYFFLYLISNISTFHILALPIPHFLSIHC